MREIFNEYERRRIINENEAKWSEENNEMEEV